MLMQARLWFLRMASSGVELVLSEPKSVFAQAPRLCRICHKATAPRDFTVSVQPRHFRISSRNASAEQRRARTFGLCDEVETPASTGQYGHPNCLILARDNKHSQPRGEIQHLVIRLLIVHQAAQVTIRAQGSGCDSISE